MKKVSILQGVMAVLFLSSPAHATIWYVHPDSTLNSIQAGIDSCTTGDTVLVGPGTYLENINFNGKAITVKSEHGPDTTIIDGGSPTNPDTGSVVLFISGEDTNSVLKGFTITNGTGTFDPNYSSYDGGGIYCRYSSSPTIIGNIITGNTATSGSGIICWHYSSPTIAGNTITSNTANTTGGGIACFAYSSPIIMDNAITQNEGGVYGGAIGTNNSYPPLTIIGNTITGNVADSGCIALWDTPAEIIRNTISMNSTGAGIGCRGGVTIHIDSCTISNNELYGVWSDSAANPEIHYCNIYGHTAYGVVNRDSTFMVDAEYNWWGDPSGPGGAGPGTGDSVNMWVDYDPWLDHPVSQPTAVIDIDPNTLNLKSHGKWVTCYTEFSEGYSVEDIDINSVAIISIDGNAIDPLYRSGPTSIGDYDEDGIPDLMVKFDRQALIAILRTMIEPPAYVELEVGGMLVDSVPYSGVDTIRVISPGHEHERYNNSDGKEIARLCGLRPNPFAETTEIRYEITDMSNAEIRIYDAAGCLVRQWDNPTLRQSDHIFWDGTDRANRKLSNGVYFIELRTDEYAETSKLMLIR